MHTYTVMVVSDDQSPVRRFQLAKRTLRRAGVALATLIALGGLAAFDYLQKWRDTAELAELRLVSEQQADQIARFSESLEAAETDLARIRDLERKIRIIANLPVATAVGGSEVTAWVPDQNPGPPARSGQQAIPVGVPIQAISPASQAVESESAPLDSARWKAVQDAWAQLGGRAERRVETLELLLEELDVKGQKLASMPSVWPARGWLTSGFGSRVSPFTGRKQHHSGIDIAAAEGTAIVSPARGRVHFVGRKGAMGNTLIVDHGFGVKTVYGHTSKIHVKPGQEVARGQRIASIGSTGRSTGPHLHYVVEVAGQPRNPLDYIFD
ncbi:MAG: M23 family metallopeptidase [Myxococcota bacterium]|nr:M23 family metallopeptidase [Myxococcota bacterium]